MLIKKLDSIKAVIRKGPSYRKSRRSPPLALETLAQLGQCCDCVAVIKTYPQAIPEGG